MGDDAYKGHLLFADTGSDQIVLEEMRVVNVTTDVTLVLLLECEALLGLTC